MEYFIYLVGKRRVEIIERYTHTYLVQYYDNGKQSSVHRKYVKKWYPNKNKKPQKKIKPIINQLKFKL